MKKLAVTLASLGFATSSALAALPATVDPTLVSVPQLPGGFVAGVQGYYLEPTVTNGLGDYASVNLGTNNLFGSNLKSVDPGFDWGWGANIGYIFPNTGNDINLNYFHFDTDDTASTIGGPLSSVNFFQTFQFLPLQGLIILVPSIITEAAQAKEEFDLNQVDLTVGQFIDVGCRLILHPETGLRFADIKHDLNAEYVTFAGGVAFEPELLQQTIDPFSLAIVSGFHEESDFQGIGPMIGIDATYYLGAGFGLVGHFDSALLVGNIDSELTTVTSWTGFSLPNLPQRLQSLTVQDSFKADSIDRIVPNWDAKLGVDYTFLFGNESNSDLTLEIGYQVSHYYNAIDILSASGTSLLTFSIPALNLPSSLIFTPGNRHTGDFSLAGPYASLTLHL